MSHSIKWVGQQDREESTVGSSRCALVALSIAVVLWSAPPVQAQDHVPVQWSEFVRVQGQSELVPVQWLQDEEARFAHNIKLPDVVAKTVPFDFDKARWRAWLPGVPEVGRQYFEHLCDTEAGEWLLKKAPPQPGIYNARPMRRYSTPELQARYDLEAPVLQRGRQVRDDIDSGTWFVGEPFMPYYFIEEPRRAVGWQSDVAQPYIRLFGYQADRPPEGLPGRPMQMVGIDRPSAPYGLTWRGTKRTHDRENSISGVEMVVYDLQTGEVLAVRRQFVYAPPYKKRPDSNSWAQGRVCPRLMLNSYGGEDVVRLPMLATPSQKALQWRQPDLVSPIPAKR